jgi:hypothetical protein
MPHRLINDLKNWIAEHPHRYYRIALAVIVLTGVSSLVLSSLMSAGSLLTRLMEELGIALTIAAILAVVIETYARLKFAAEEKKDAIQAIYGRVIPSVVFDQIRHHILTADAVRKEYHLTLTLTEELKDRPGDFECKATLTYKVHNITGYSPKHTITHGLDYDLARNDSTGNPLPRFVSVTIGENSYTGEALRPLVKEFRFTKEIQLPEDNVDLSVAVVAIHIVRVPDTWNWNISSLSEGATLTIIVDEPAATSIEFIVRALHPEREELKAMKDNGKDGKWSWEFKRALLPWQGFEFSSRRRGAGVPIVSDHPAA